MVCAEVAFFSRGPPLTHHPDTVGPTQHEGAACWERLIGGQRLVARDSVERAIHRGYAQFRNDMNLVLYANLVMNAAKGI